MNVVKLCVEVSVRELCVEVNVRELCVIWRHVVQVYARLNVRSS